jgi:hypothetical protein
MEDVHNWEAHASVSTADALGRVVKRLPDIWRGRRRAAGDIARLPPLERRAPTPGAEQIYEWIEGLCATPHRRPGTAEGHRGERWVADRMGEVGLTDVTLDPVEITRWDASRWSLRVEGEWVPSFYVVNTGFTGAGGVRGRLAWVGTGRRRDFDRADVAGKIVVAEVPFPRLPTGLLMRAARAAYALSDPTGAVGLSSSQVMSYVRRNFLGGARDAAEAPEADVYWQAQARGAKAICLVLRDQPSGSNSHYGPYDGLLKPMPGLWVGKHDGARLERLARRGAYADLALEGRTEPGVMHTVWGVLPGASDETVLVTSHHDAPFRGATEDAAGVAQVLAQAWAWSRVPRAERRRTLVFVVDAGHFYGSAGAHAWARTHPDVMARTRVLLTLEHLGAVEVRERAGAYTPTGRPAFTVMFTTPDPTIVAAVTRALRESAPPATASIPADFLGPTPTSDAMGYVKEAGVPVVSWIGCPYYLLDRFDTLDKIDRASLEPVCRTATDLVETFMVA